MALRSFQHLVRFFYVTTIGPVYSYGRRLLGLRFGAWTPPVNLPALGRRQSLYILFRVSRDLCFW